MISVNLFGQPGAGKSTTAAFLFYYLKSRNCNCELITEYAKSVVYEGSLHKFQNQLYITAKQHKRMFDILKNEKEKVPLIITDSPLLLGKIYARLNNQSFPAAETFCKLLDELHGEFDNINVFLKRVKKYNPSGRMQTAEESDELSVQIRTLLPHFDYEINGDTDGQKMLAEALYDRYKDLISF